MRSPGVSPQVVADFKSPSGASVTQVRGVMLVNSIQNLTTWGIYDRYLAQLPEQAKQILTATIASSWIDIEIAMQHYAIIESLGVSDALLDRAGEELAHRIADTFLRPVLKGNRASSFEGFVSFLGSYNVRLWERMYMGGGFRLTRHNERELLIEDHGNPLIAHYMVRRGYNAYMQALAKMFCETVVVREEIARKKPPYYLASRFFAR